MIHTWKPSPEEYDQCNRVTFVSSKPDTQHIMIEKHQFQKARRDGLFAGVTGGLFAGTNVLQLKP